MVYNERGKAKVWRGLASRYWDLKLNPLPPKQSVKFKCQIWFKITKKFAKKHLNASSL